MFHRSYIRKNRKIKDESEFRYQLSVQQSSLSRRIYKEWGISLDDLFILSDIYLICLDKHDVVSKIREEHRELLNKVKVVLEMC